MPGCRVEQRGRARREQGRQSAVEVNRWSGKGAGREKVAAGILRRDAVGCRVAEEKQTIPLLNAFGNLRGGHGRPPEMLGRNGRGERIGLWKGGMEAKQSLLPPKWSRIPLSQRELSALLHVSCRLWLGGKGAFCPKLFSKHNQSIECQTGSKKYVEVIWSCD